MVPFILCIQLSYFNKLVLNEELNFAHVILQVLVMILMIIVLVLPISWLNTNNLFINLSQFSFSVLIAGNDLVKP